MLRALSRFPFAAVRWLSSLKKQENEGCKIKRFLYLCCQNLRASRSTLALDQPCSQGLSSRTPVLSRTLLYFTVGIVSRCCFVTTVDSQTLNWVVTHWSFALFFLAGKLYNFNFTSFFFTVIFWGGQLGGQLGVSRGSAFCWNPNFMALLLNLRFY